MKVSEKKIYKTLDKLGISRDCPDVKRAMRELFPKVDTSASDVVDTSRISIDIRPSCSGSGAFDIGLYVDGKRVGALSGGELAQEETSQYTIKHISLHNHGGFIQVVKK